jgi:hypothetical protein
LNSEILDPAAPLTRQDARMFERLARDKSWMGNIDADTRAKIVSKLLAGYARLKVDEGMSQEDLRLNMSILDRVARTFGLLDKVDAEREAAMLREATGSVPAQHLHLHGELATMNADELRAYRERILAGGHRPGTSSPG